MTNLSKIRLLNNNKELSQKAFSLVELSVVLIIIGLLLSGSISAVQIGIKKAEMKITQKNLDASYKGIGKFLQTNNRLPCPSRITDVPESSPNFGLEARTSDASPSCNSGFVNGNLVYGAVPVRSIGLADNQGIDGYGNKIAYIIDMRLASDYIASGSLSPNLRSGTQTFGTMPDDQIFLSISEVFANSSSQVMNQDTALILISYGANMLGAFPLNQSNQNTIPASTSELENVINSSGSFDSVFTSRDSSANSTFDDILIFKKKSQITADFSMQKIVACSGEDLDPLFTTRQSAYFGGAVSQLCPSPFKDKKTETICGFYGKWTTPSRCPTVNDCKFPTNANDEILKSKVFLSDFVSQGYTNGVASIWDYNANCSGTLAHGATCSRNINPNRFTATCNDGRMIVNWY